MAQTACKILLVEDEADIRTVVQLALRQDPGFQVTAFESGEAALSAIGEGLDYFDVGLFNVRLTGMDGPELARRIRKLRGYAHLKVIFLTASVLPPQIQQYAQQGAVGVIGKPFDPVALPGQIRKLLDELGENA